MTYTIAVVGAGPSGLYATDALVSAGCTVVVIDRLPVPFGLVRYGVAPDHLSIRSVRDTLEKILERPGVTLLAGVEVGTDVTVVELLQAYDAVVLTYGASRDRRLDIGGEDLLGSVAATDLVAWYCGHPDADIEIIEDALDAATAAVVVGVGNVSVDVTRVLTAPRERLGSTDMPEHVLDALDRSGITDVHVLGRRGPAQATWTTKELKELGELEGVDVVVDPADLVLEPVSEALVAADRVVARNVEVIRGWAERGLTGAPRRIHLHFHSRPAEILGEGRMTGVVVERTTIDADGSANGTGETFQIPAQLAVRSVGYRGVALDAVPFDARRNVIPNVDGRVIEGDAAVAGLYVAGWIKRGPTGVIGTNKKDASATVDSLLADLEGTPARGGSGIAPVLRERGVQVVGFEGWRAIDAAERALGESRGRVRTTLHDRHTLMAAAKADGSSAP